MRLQLPWPAPRRPGPSKAPAARRLRGVLAGLFVLLWASGAAAAAALDKPTADRIDKAAQAWIASGRTPGLAIAVMRHGQVVYLKGFGQANLETPAPVTPESVFLIGSLTKQFTAAAVLTLVDQGRVSLDDKLSKYLPDFQRGDEVTIRQLLQHTSGISAYSDRTNPSTRWDYRSDLTTDQMVARIGTFKPPYQFDPGTAWHYNNSGYFILGAVIEKVTGKSLAAYLEEGVLSKAGLPRTALDNGLDVVPLRVAGYEVKPGSPTGFRRADILTMTIPGGAGAMRSTVGDLLKWQEALFAGKVVSPASLAEMVTPARLKDGRLASAVRAGYGDAPMASFEYGFGLFLTDVDGHRKISHNGGINGFNSTLNAYPDNGLVWVALSNSSGGVSDESGGLGLGLLSGISAQIETILLSSPTLGAGRPPPGPR